MLDCAFDDPTEADLALAIGLRVDAEAEREALDELADAMLVWADGQADRLTPAAVERIWTEELEHEIRKGLAEARRMGPEWRRAAERALAALERNPRRAPITFAVVQDLAHQLSEADHPWFVCTGCLEEALAHAAPEARRALASTLAVVARRNAGVPASEAKEALAAAGREPPVDRLGTQARRVAVRVRLGRVGTFAHESMPVLAAELCRMGDEPLPVRARDDDVWNVVCEAILAEIARPELN